MNWPTIGIYRLHTKIYKELDCPTNRNESRPKLNKWMNKCTIPNRYGRIDRIDRTDRTVQNRLQASRTESNRIQSEHDKHRIEYELWDFELE